MADLVIFIIGLIALGIAWLASAPWWVFVIILVLFFGLWAIFADDPIDLNPFD